MLVLGPAASAASASGMAARDDDVAFTIKDPRINESSGLAASTRHPGIVYTHNDSGGVPKIYALDGGGRVKAVLTLGGAGARDWEAMALGRDGRGRPAIFVADIGDNLGGAWPYVTIYRIPEPTRLRSQTLHATAFKIKYEDGPRNAETFMINPRTNRIFIASKQFGGKVYEGPAKLRTSGYNTMRKVGDAPAMATDGAFSPDGRTCVIRTYFGARLYSVGPDGRPGKSLKSINTPFQAQGESVTYTADGNALLVGSEGTNQPVYRLPLPDEARPSPSGKAATGHGGSAADIEKSDRDPAGTRMGLFLALAIAAAVGYGLLRRRGGSSKGG
ncbi:WD40 repeat domain-containing protein [Actinomadura meridiana]|uniref:WD40 repeat domain-containing protein n=2 Tax=Actinomadura meridiana TaxID=559626 RepID=A0ABP8CNS1_9ACTN